MEEGERAKFHHQTCSKLTFTTPLSQNIIKCKGRECGRECGIKRGWRKEREEEREGRGKECTQSSRRWVVHLLEAQLHAAASVDTCTHTCRRSMHLLQYS